LNGIDLTNERWLKWAVARYYRSVGYKVSMKPARAGNAMVDGVAVTPEGERIAIEVKSPSDDIIRGVSDVWCMVNDSAPELLFFAGFALVHPHFLDYLG
jgi:hypothetical protein